MPAHDVTTPPGSETARKRDAPHSLTSSCGGEPNTIAELGAFSSAAVPRPSRKFHPFMDTVEPASVPTQPEALTVRILLPESSET